jgi:uncharacterized protein YhfF
MHATPLNMDTAAHRASGTCARAHTDLHDETQLRTRGRLDIVLDEEREAVPKHTMHTLVVQRQRGAVVVRAAAC